MYINGQNTFLLAAKAISAIASFFFWASSSALRFSSASLFSLSAFSFSTRAASRAARSSCCCARS